MPNPSAVCTPFLITLLAGCSPAAEAIAAEPAAPASSTVAVYTLDPAKSSLYVQVYKDPDTLASGLSHDHVIAATGWTGSVTWDTANVAACKVSITVPASGLVNDEDALRRRVGYDTTLDEDQRANVKEHMLDSGQLDAQVFPNVTFTSTGCVASGAGVIVNGTMSMHGVGKAVAPLMNITADGKNFTAKGTLTVKTTSFGIDPYSALLGQLKNQDGVRFTIDVKGGL